MGLLEDIETRLKETGVGSSAGSTDFPISLRGLQSANDSNIGIRRTGGRAELAPFNAQPADIVDNVSFQITVRGDVNSTEIEDKVDDVISVLDGFNGVLNDVRYYDVRKQGDSLFLGYDENHRPIYSLNWIANKGRIPEVFFAFDAAHGLGQVADGTYIRADTATNYIEGGDQTERLLSTSASGVARIGWFTTS